MSKPEKRETLYKRALMDLLHDVPSLVAFRVELPDRAGIPDIHVAGGGLAAWYEVKHATPTFESTGIQELTCLRLARACYCRYIIYHEDAQGQNKRTLIVHPSEIHSLKPEEEARGFDHQFVVEFIRRKHRSWGRNDL